MLPRYSIIVPVYNVKEWVRECLDSVLRQTFPDWECVCVDDGSTDGSSAILDEYAREDARFRVIHKKNGGVSSARNVALDNVCGDWLIYLDADDILTDVCLEALNRCLELCPEADILQIDIADMPEHTSGCPFHEVNLKARIPVFFKKRMDIVGGIVDVSFVTYAYKREICGSIRFANYTFGEDRLYLATCLLRCYLKARIDVIGYGCRMRNGSTMHSDMTLRKFYDNVMAKFDVINLFASMRHIVSKCTKRMLVCGLLEHAIHHIDRIPKSDASSGWRVWFECVESLPKSMVVTNWQRMVHVVIALTHSRLLARLLCIWPHRLKLKKSKWLRKSL